MTTPPGPSSSTSPAGSTATGPSSTAAVGLLAVGLLPSACSPSAGASAAMCAGTSVGTSVGTPPSSWAASAGGAARAASGSPHQAHWLPQRSTRTSTALRAGRGNRSPSRASSADHAARLTPPPATSPMPAISPSNVSTSLTCAPPSRPRWSAYRASARLVAAYVVTAGASPARRRPPGGRRRGAGAAARAPARGHRIGRNHPLLVLGRRGFEMLASRLVAVAVPERSGAREFVRGRFPHRPSRVRKPEAPLRWDVEHRGSPVADAGSSPNRSHRRRSTSGTGHREVVQRREGLRVHHARRRSAGRLRPLLRHPGEGYRSLEENQRVEFDVSRARRARRRRTSEPSEKRAPEGPPQEAANVRAI